MNYSFVNPPSATLRSAVDMLGWGGSILVELDLFGSRLLVAAAPVDDEIARRVSEHLSPVVDPWLFRCRADLDTAFLSRPSPVRILGAMAARQRWPAARKAASMFTAFGPRVAALPPQACRASALTEAAVTGIGVLSMDGDTATALALPGRPTVAKRTHVHRLVEETVWDAISRTPAYAPQAYVSAW
jgi:hypothetical protein